MYKIIDSCYYFIGDIMENSLIEIINSIEELPLQKSGELISTKKNKKIHGYGIKSIKKIVKKYNGTFGCQVQ